MDRQIVKRVPNEPWRGSCLLRVSIEKEEKVGVGFLKLCDATWFLRGSLCVTFFWKLCFLYMQAVYLIKTIKLLILIHLFLAALISWSFTALDFQFNFNKIRELDLCVSEVLRHDGYYNCTNCTNFEQFPKIRILFEFWKDRISNVCLFIFLKYMENRKFMHWNRLKKSLLSPKSQNLRWVIILWKPDINTRRMNN